MTTADYAQLVEGCRKHDRRAQRRLYDLLAPAAMGVCMRYLRSRDEAQDVMQEGFVRVFESLGRLRDPSKVEAWAYRVMVNECLAHFRQRRLSMASDEPTEEVPLPPTDPFVGEEVVLALRQLPPQQQVVFNLMAVEECSYEEAAHELRCTTANVRALYSRAKARLRDILTETNNRVRI